MKNRKIIEEDIYDIFITLSQGKHECCACLTWIE